jgi:hypothetical protein
MFSGFTYTGFTVFSSFAFTVSTFFGFSTTSLWFFKDFKGFKGVKIRPYTRLFTYITRLCTYITIGGGGSAKDAHSLAESFDSKDSYKGVQYAILLVTSLAQ